MLLRIALLHLPHVLNHLERIQYPQCIGQHESLHRSGLQSIDQLKNVFRRMLHTATPILQIHIHQDALAMCIINGFLDIVDMLFRTLLQLLGTMLQRTFAQQVEYLTTSLTDPVHRCLSVHETKYLHFMQMIASSRPFANHADSLHFAFRNSGRSNFHTVYFQVLQQQTGYHQLFMRNERNSTGLFTVAERGIHDFYLDAFSHASILSLLSTKKSISSNPFIRQCFL